MTITLRFLAVIVIALGAIFAVACADDSDNGDDNGDASPTASAGDNTPAAGETPDDEPSGNGGDAGDLRDAISRFIDATFTAEYTMTGELLEGVSSGSMTIYKDGRDRFRFDVSGEQDGVTANIIFIETPEVQGFCLSDAAEFGEVFGIPAGEGVCFNNDPTGGEGLGDFTSDLEQLQNEDIELLEESERMIAGQSANCYRTRDAEGEVSFVCVSSDGVLLLAQDDEGNGIEATSVRDSVDGGVFDLPYEVRELPGLPQ